jgi:hypothetical protein
LAVQSIKVGVEQTLVLIIDDFVQDPDHLIDLAEALAPFPAPPGNYYPGLRHQIAPTDGENFTYVQSVCRALVPLMHSAYGVKRYDVADAGYSMVTTPPSALKPLQAIPHFDHPDTQNYAILHYLSKTPAGGTAFYRHRRTGFETLSKDRLDAYSAAREQDIAEFGIPQGYHVGDTNGFVELAQVEARFNRAVIYPGRLLHSAVITDDCNFSHDPRKGRLTCNIFIRALE